MMRRRASRSLEILPRLRRDERAGVDQQVYRVRRSPQDLPDGKFSPSNSLAESSSGRHYRNSILNGHDRGAELRGINERS